MDKMMDKIGRELNLAVLSIIKMPRIPKPLTSHELRKIKNKTVAVGGVAGLYFRNTPQQSIFFFRFQDQNGRHDLSLGNYPDMSLAQARDTATNLRAQLANGQDLLAVRKQSQAPKQPLKDILTFKQAAKEWHSERSRLDFWGDNAKGEIRAYRILEMHVFCQASFKLTPPRGYFKSSPNNFGYTSPVKNHWARRSIGVSTLMLFLVFFAPIAIEPMIFPLIMAAITVAIGIAFGNIQKQI